MAASPDHRGTPERPGRTVTLHQDSAARTFGVAYELAGTPEQQQETLKYLEWREKQYDIRQHEDVYQACEPRARAHGTASQGGVDGSAEAEGRAGSSDGPVEQLDYRNPADGHSRPRQTGKHAGERVVVKGCLVYIAGPDKSRNANYLGPASLQDIAQTIATSHGPSGPNCDYLFGLAKATREMGVEDEELFELERIVRGIMATTPSEEGQAAPDPQSAAALSEPFS